MSLKRRKNGIIYLASCLMIGMVFISCSKDEIETPEVVSSEQAITKLKSYFYRDGEVFANHLARFKPTEWGLVINEAQKPLEAFTDITGLPAPFKENYNYSYRSPDGKCSISITGSKNVNPDGIFATLKVNIPECPEINTIYFTTVDFFYEFNSNGLDAGVPVIYLR